jgi:hypothetical protein
MASTPEDWSNQQNATFMRVYRFMLTNQAAMNHPKAAPMPVDHWHTVCHNAAYVAAESLETSDFRILDADTQELIAYSPQGLAH